jgi:hypothetical protein
MPDTPANVDRVTAAYEKWQRRLNEFKSKVPGITQADVDSAYKIMQAAIREWEKPGEGETKSSAKSDRKPKRKRFWPKWK